MRRWPILAGILILSTAVLWFYRSSSAPTSKNRKKEFIRVQPLRTNLEETVEATGVVEPRNRIEIKPPVSGRIEEVKVVEGQSVRQAEVLALMSSTDRAALLDAARTHGEEILRKWTDVYRATPLLAPIDGTVIARKTEPGQTVTPTDVVLVLADRLIIRARVDETDIALVQPGQKVRLTLDAYPSVRFTGNVRHIAYEAVTVNNVTMYEVEIEPEDPPAQMKSGMTVTCRFLIRHATDALCLPIGVVQEENGLSFVWVPQSNGPPQRREVELGLRDGNIVQIVSGLNESETVLQPSFEWPQSKPVTRNPFMPRPPRAR